MNATVVVHPAQTHIEVQGLKSSVHMLNRRTLATAIISEQTLEHMLRLEDQFKIMKDEFRAILDLPHATDQDPPPMKPDNTKLVMWLLFSWNVVATVALGAAVYLGN